VQGIDYGMLKIKHLISYIKSVVQKRYFERKKSEIIIYTYETNE